MPKAPLRLPAPPATPPTDFENWKSFWLAIDAALASHPPSTGRRALRRLIVELRRRPDRPGRGHAYFRLAGDALLIGGDELEALRLLNMAYEEDQRTHRPEVSPQDMAAYRMLNLVSDIGEWLSQGHAGEVGKIYARGAHRRILMRTVAMTFNRTIGPLLNQGVLLDSHFTNRLLPGDECIYVVESYRLAHKMLLLREANGFQFGGKHQYPMGRALCSLLGSGVEAVLLTRVRIRRGRRSFSTLLLRGRSRGIWPRRSTTEAAMILLYYFRNHIHPAVALRRPKVPVDLNTARSMLHAFEIALDGIAPC